MIDKPVLYACTIGRPRREVYQYWRDWKNLPLFSRHLKSVEDIGENRTRWTSEGPNGDNVVEELKMRTGGRGPDVCIDAVGMEAFGHGAGAIVDYAKQIMRMESDRPNVLRQAITACRKGGTLSIPGVYGGLIDAIPFGAAFNKALSFRMGQTHVHRYLPKLLEHIQKGDIDPSFIITHRMSLDDAPRMYQTFKEKSDGCIKVVMKPHMAASREPEVARRDDVSVM